jgi:hypothetical protein
MDVQICDPCLGICCAVLAEAVGDQVRETGDVDIGSLVANGSKRITTRSPANDFSEGEQTAGNPSQVSGGSYRVATPTGRFPFRTRKRQLDTLVVARSEAANVARR